jgi:hypothetical protein
MKEAAPRDEPVNIVAVHEIAANQWAAYPMVTPEDEAMTGQARS